MLAEVTTKEISKSEKPVSFNASLEVAITGGNIAGNARKDIETRLGRSVISKANAKNKGALDESPKTLGLNGAKNK